MSVTSCHCQPCSVSDENWLNSENNDDVISSNYKGSDSDNAMPKKRPQLQILTMMEVIITMMTMMILRSRGGDQGSSHLQQLKNRSSQKSMIPENISVHPI